MPVHNAFPFLDAAIESILSQTEPDFEFIIFDDGSTDGSLERLREWAGHDDRIRLVQGAENLGPALSSQKVAAEASAPLVARMDADDVAYPERLREQVAVFRKHPEAGVVASLCDFIDSNGTKLRETEGWRLARQTPFVPFVHGTMMYRSELFQRVGGYRQQAVYWEDQDLVTRMAALAPVMIIPKPLYQYRLNVASTRITSDQEQLERSVDLMYHSVKRVEQKLAYDDLLPKFDSAPSRVNPRVFISLGSQLLWAGGKPRLFRRALKRGELRPDRNTLLALIWTGWASVSPATLRMFLRLLVHTRNSFAKPYVASDGLAVWDPFDRATTELTEQRDRLLPSKEASNERTEQDIRQQHRSRQ